VIGYRTDRFPAFYSRDSGLGVDARLDTPEAVARVMHAKWDLELGGGLVIANPVPAAFEMPRDVMERAIDQAVEEARAQGIGGKALTPFLLARINALTDGESLDSNVELVLNNARLAAQVAVAYAR